MAPRFPLKYSLACRILTGMIPTVRHLTTPRVAAAGEAPARAWLARQRAWERRLAELERPAAAGNRRDAAGPLRRTA
jgi:hypothetical protein